MLRHLDGWDLVDQPGFYLKYSRSTSFEQSLVLPGRDGFGQSFFLFNTAFGEANYVKILDAQPTWIWGMDFKLHTTSSQGYVRSEWFRWGTVNGTLFSLRMRTDGKMEFLRGSGESSPVIAVTPSAIPFETWINLQMKLAIGEHGGYSLLADGVELIGDHNINLGTANPDRLTHRWQNFGNSGINLDNYWICDGQGSRLNDFLGACRVTAHYPLTVFGASNWAQNAGALVDSVADRSVSYPDGDATYIEPPGASSLQLFTMTAPACFGLVLAAALNVCARPEAPSQSLDVMVKTKTLLSAIASAVPLVDVGGALEPGVPLLSGYQVYQAIAALSYETGFAWSDAELASAGWGVRSTDRVGVRVTQLILEKLTSLDPSNKFNCGPGNYSY